MLEQLIWHSRNRPQMVENSAQTRAKAALVQTVPKVQTRARMSDRAWNAFILHACHA